MSQIDYEKVQLIVENNMRNSGYSGQYENGWKNSIIADGVTYNQTINLQNLRDVIAKSVVDALTNANVTGTISSGNIQGQPIVVSDESIINITKQESLPSSPAARKGDSISINQLTDPNFMIWVQTMTGVVNALVGGAIPAIIAISGTVATGSSSVEIGD